MPTPGLPPTPIPRAITYIHTYYYCYYHPSTYLLRFSHIFSYYTQKQTLEGETSGGRVMPQKEEEEEPSSKTRFILQHLSVSATTPHLYTTPQPSSLGKEQESKGVFIIPCYFLFFCSCFCPFPPATKGSEQRHGQLGSPNLAWLMESKTRKEFYYY